MTLTAPVSDSTAEHRSTQTLWGLTPHDLHDRFWASRGIQVVRQGESSAIVPHAELFLLTDSRTLVLFRPASILDRVAWLRPDFVAIRILDRRRKGFTERVEAHPDGRFKRFTRTYDGADPQLARVGLTTDPELARFWQSSESPRAAWRRLRRIDSPASRFATRLEGRVFDATQPESIGQFIRELVGRWQHPDTTIDGVRQAGERVWVFGGAEFQPGPALRGPIWIGAGRAIGADQVAIGPAVLWDDPAKRPPTLPVAWQEIEAQSATLPPPPSPGAQAQRLQRRRPFKRLFDVVFSLLVLAVTLPLFPIVALLIMWEDGLPIFFGHERETIGGRRFSCLKFRSMRKDAEQMKETLAAQNKADGPQFYIPDDPRLTRIGRVIRDLQIDELPQFINVLKGDMSVVGPRPSPFRENQYCPPWREARLSVRPGITGLWQTSRTRNEGADFQEWIRYDIEYVERQSFLLDLVIIWRTALLVIRKATMA